MRRLGDDHVDAVNLPNVEERRRVTIECSKSPKAVLPYPFRRIAHRPANIQRSPGFRTDSSMTGKDSVGYIRIERFEGKVANSGVVVKRHRYFFAATTANFLARVRCVSAMTSSTIGNPNQAVVKPNRKPVSVRMNGVLS